MFELNILIMAPAKQFLTLQQKIKVIEVYNQEKLSVRKLSERFKIGKTQAAEIIKNKYLNDVLNFH